MGCLKRTLSFTISQTPLKCQDTAVLGREFRVASPGWSSVWPGNSKKLDSSTGRTQCTQAAAGPSVSLFSLVNSRQVHIRITSLGGRMGWNKRENLGKTAGGMSMSDRHFQSLIQSATSHFLGNTQGNCSCLRARLLYSEGEKFAWSIVCKGIRQSRC